MIITKAKNSGDLYQWTRDHIVWKMAQRLLKKWEPGDVLVEKGEKDELFYFKKKFLSKNLNWYKSLPFSFKFFPFSFKFSLFSFKFSQIFFQIFQNILSNIPHFHSNIPKFSFKSSKCFCLSSTTQTSSLSQDVLKGFLTFSILFIYSLGNQVVPRLLKFTPAVYPHLKDFTGKLNFRNKSRPTQLRILKPS